MDIKINETLKVDFVLTLYKKVVNKDCNIYAFTIVKYTIISCKGFKIKGFKIGCKGEILDMQ